MPSPNAKFFDGKTARPQDVHVGVDQSGLLITGTAPDILQHWAFPGLEAIEPPSEGRPLRLRHASAPDERLVVEDPRIVVDIVRESPALRRALHPGRVAKYTFIAAVGLVVAAGVGYVLLSLLPPLLAQLMPESWRENLSAEAEQQFLGRYPKCSDADGQNALNILADRLFAGQPDKAPEFSVQIYKLPMINAFTLPKGRIVLSGSLLAAATSPEEVAGVLAHELGHARYRDPEVALLRLMGLQLFVSLATGQQGGSAISNFFGLTVFLRYSRFAEERADLFAQDVLTGARIDPLGLKRFFERMEALESRRGGSLLPTPLGDIFSTHPGTKERIERIKPLENGPPLLVMSEAEWKSLRNICR